MIEHNIHSAVKAFRRRNHTSRFVGEITTSLPPPSLRPWPKMRHADGLKTSTTTIDIQSWSSIFLLSCRLLVHHWKICRPQQHSITPLYRGIYTQYGNERFKLPELGVAGSVCTRVLSVCHLIRKKTMSPRNTRLLICCPLNGPPPLYRHPSAFLYIHQIPLRRVVCIY